MKITFGYSGYAKFQVLLLRTGEFLLITFGLFLILMSFISVQEGFVFTDVIWLYGLFLLWMVGLFIVHLNAYPVVEFTENGLCLWLSVIKGRRIGTIEFSWEEIAEFKETQFFTVCLLKRKRRWFHSLMGWNYGGRFQPAFTIPHNIDDHEYLIGLIKSKHSQYFAVLKVKK